MRFRTLRGRTPNVAENESHWTREAIKTKTLSTSGWEAIHCPNTILNIFFQRIQKILVG